MSLLALAVNLLAAVGFAWILTYLWPLFVLAAAIWFFTFIRRTFRDEP